jgi:hypothetical protein
VYAWLECERGTQQCMHGWNVDVTHVKVNVEFARVFVSGRYGPGTGASFCSVQSCSVQRA